MASHCLLAGGHVLLEGVPDWGKTTLLRTLCACCISNIRAFSFTPDLMPGDIVGSMIIDTGKRSQGLPLPARPIFAHLVQPTKSIARTPRRNRPCSKPCRSTPLPAAPHARVGSAFW